MRAFPQWPLPSAPTIELSVARGSAVARTMIRIPPELSHIAAQHALTMSNLGGLESLPEPLRGWIKARIGEELDFRTAVGFDAPPVGGITLFGPDGDG